MSDAGSIRAEGGLEGPLNFDAYTGTPRHEHL